MSGERSDADVRVPVRSVPGGRWGLTWLATGVLFVTCAVGLELFVRARGYQPSVKEDNYSWALERRRASDGSARTVAILGASRILLAFSPTAFREELPGYKYVQLAVQSSAPVGSLRDLAFDPDFRGIAIVDIAEIGFWKSTWDDQDALIAAYHRGWRAAGQLAERSLTTSIQSRVALLSSSGLRVIDSLLTDGSWPGPPYTRTFPDRTKYADYDLVDVERKRRVRLARIDNDNASQQDADAWLADALALEVYVALIQARGGKVVYVRMPTCDERWTNDELHTPKQLFWDRLASVTQATAIHFKDHESLSSFECPDTSHIDSKDARRFTQSLLRILAARKLLDP